MVNSVFHRSAERKRDGATMQKTGQPTAWSAIIHMEFNISAETKARY
jgi:hypothetical protein